MFGGYIGNEIVVGKPVNDPSCFVFSLKKDGMFNQRKFNKKEQGYSYKILSNASFLLMGFGLKDHTLKDLYIYTKDYSCSGRCFQYAFDYGNEDHAFCGKTHFNVKRIIVYQMK